MTNAKETVGFIGLGMMGHGMAKNIIEKGYPLTIIAHRNRKPIDDLIARGAVEVKTVKELASRSSIVFLCVTGSREVEAAVRGNDGLKDGLKRGAVVVDTSTADPNSTLSLAAELAPLGVEFVDAPLARTPKEAWEGTLGAMIGASEETYARILPVVKTWAKDVVHIGAVGDGHKLKLINNFIALGYGAIYAEALALGAKVGITPQKLDSVIRGGRMDSGFYQTFMAYVLDGDREGHKFTLTNALKDLNYLESMADSAGLINTVGNAVKNSYATAVAAGGNGPTDYVPRLSEFIARANGVPPPPRN